MRMNRKQKKSFRIFNLLSEKTKLNYNPGPIILNKRKPNKKVRRHSGRKTIFIDGEYPYMETFYDDWIERRDGFRDDSDLTKKTKRKNGFWILSTKKHKEINKKINKQIQIRKLMKFKPLLFFYKNHISL